MKQARVIISGTVQRVGYRYFVRSNARKLGLKGWVQNTEDGKVEALFQGSQEKIEAMLGICRQGPMLSDVKAIEVEWEEANEPCESFEIRR